MTESAQVELRGTIWLRDRLIAVIFAILVALALCWTPAHSQTIAFEFQTHPDSPIAFINYTPTTIRSGSDRRQFVAVKNESRKDTAALVFQQTILSGATTEIVSLERISMIIRPGQKKRMAVSVGDVWSRIQTAGKSGETIGKPVLSVVTVEFLDGTLWSAPMGQ